ncbi:trans-aconitate 2-methyltransferase-like [Rhopilema esculentum]|uniref:trans-aconitate 2-methyltransferase-like n=1 Tax=Rhopilema esculentum TaxID=499914 RepID=UPI0031D85594|eukprot:gene15700-6993_t
MAEIKSSSETYSRLSTSMQEAYAKVLVDRIKFSDDSSSVLEIGCGTGATAAYLARDVVRNGTVTGCDPQENRIRVAAEKYSGIEGLEFIKSTGVEALKGKEQAYDVIYSNSVLHWMSDEEFEETMRLSFVAMKSGGFAAHNVVEAIPENVVKVIANSNPEDLKSLYEMIKPISLGRLVDVSAKVGFKVVDSGRIPTVTKFDDLKEYLRLQDATLYGKYGIEEGYMINSHKIDLAKDEDGKIIHVSPLVFIVLQKL